MKTRHVTLFSGHSFTVPQGIQRIDTRATHGWQVRYHGTKFFADGSSDGSGAARSLDAATRELLHRIATLPAPVVLQKAPSVSKSSDLPPGISGPILVPPRRRTGTRTAVLSVLLPRFGQEPRVKSIYIGTERTYSHRRFEDALAKAIELRAEVVRKYEETATRSKRKQALALKATLRDARKAAAASSAR
jgi:hypothetical protein